MSKCTYNYNGVEYSELEFKKILKDLELPLSELSQEDLNLFKEHVMFIHDIQNYRLLNRYTVIHNNGYYDTAIRKVLIPVDSINKENILANIIKFKGLNPLFNLYHLFNEHTIKLIDSTPEIDSKDRLYEYRLAMLLQNNVENTWLNKLLLDLQIGINNTLNTNYDLEVIKNFLSHNINIVESQTVLPDTTESIDVESLLNQLGLDGKTEFEQEPNVEIVDFVTEIRQLANTDISNIQTQNQNKSNELIRLYRIENTNILYDESIEGIVSKREIIGQFFTDSINTVANYLKKNQKEDGINLVYVDIPKSDLDKYHVSNNEFSKTMDVESDNWIIPQSIARNYVDLSSVTKVTGNFLTLNKAKKELTEIINNLPEPKLNNNFIGNFSAEGRGTFEGDGKDKAMRNQAVGFIGELNPNKEDRFDSSTYGSFKHFNNNSIEEERYLENVPEDTSNGNKIMLALNGSIADTDILQKTKDKILELHNRGFEFLVGDMPGGENRIGDDKFIDYLKSIGANFTVFGSGNNSRILYQRVGLTEQQRKNIQELKQLEPAYAVASDEKVQEFIDTIYPDSKIKNLVFRGLSNKSDIVVNNNSYWTPSYRLAEDYIDRQQSTWENLLLDNNQNVEDIPDEKWNSFQPVLQIAVINSQNPYYNNNSVFELDNYENYDTTVGMVSDVQGLEPQILVYSKKQITILNSPETINRFNEFIGNTNPLINEKSLEEAKLPINVEKLFEDEKFANEVYESLGYKNDTTLPDDNKVHKILSDINKQHHLGNIIDLDGDTIYDFEKTIFQNGLVNLTSNQWGHGAANTPYGEKGIERLENILSKRDRFTGDFGPIRGSTLSETNKYPNAWETGRFMITRNDNNFYSKDGSLNINGIEIILNRSFEPYGSYLASKYPNIIFKDAFGNIIKISNQLTPKQKQEAIHLYSQYLKQNPNGDVENFKSWIEEFKNEIYESLGYDIRQLEEDNMITNLFLEARQDEDNKRINSGEFDDTKLDLKVELQDIIDNSTNPLLVELARSIQYNKSLNSIKAFSTQKPFITSDGFQPAAAYQAETQRLILFLGNKSRFANKERKYQYLLHELVHHFVDRQLILTYSSHANNIKELFKYAKDELTKLGKKILYGLQNAHEFVTEALTNPDFQRELKNLKVSDKFLTKVTSLFDYLLELISNILGTNQSVLEAVITQASDIFEIQEYKKSLSITPEQKQEALSLYSKYVELNPNGNIEEFKSWVNEFNNMTKLQGAYDFSASSNSGKWNSANNELLSLVQDNRKAFAIYKFLIGDMETFKEIVDYLNERGIEIPYTDRMKRADETMSEEERKSAIDSYNSSVDSKIEDKAQVEKNILSENNLQDEIEYTPQELIEKYPLTGVQKVIWNLIKDIVNNLGIKVKFSSSRITEGFDGSNNPQNGEILIRPSTLKNGRFGEVLVHEIVHALTTKIISRVNSGVTTGLTQKQISAVKGLMKLFEAIKADNNLENKYPVKDVFEFIAHLTNETFVKELESKDKNFIQKVVDFILGILDINNANELTKKYLLDIISDGVFLQENGITVLPSDYGSNLQGSLSDFISQKSQENNSFQQFQQSLNKPNTNPILQGSQKPDVILPIGTSGSGKSTFIKSLPQENLVVIEPDAMRVEFSKPKIIFGHPGLGKTFLRETNNDFIDVDNDYKEDHTMQKILRNYAKKTRKKEDFIEWENFITTWWNKIKNDAEKTGKQIFVSNLPILEMFPTDFDKVITMSRETFIERSKQRNDYIPGIDGTEGWKDSLDAAISNIDKSKIITTDKYLSELIKDLQGDMNDKSKDKEIYEEAANRAIQAIKKGKQVVFDTTNLTKDKRLPFIEAIKKEIPTANIQYKLMELNPELAKQRIKAQIERGENRANVSEETIDRHAESYKQMLEDIKNEPITNFDYKEEQLKKFNELQELISNNEFIQGAKLAFESSDLKDYGTLENYIDYIARVSLGIIKNPSSGEYNYESKLKDIVYHGTDNKDVKFYKNNTEGFFSKVKGGTPNAIFFSKDKAPKDSVYTRAFTLSVLLDLKKPFNRDDKGDRDSYPENYKTTINNAENNGFDGVRILNTHDNFDTDVFVVFDPEQIHILGSKQDVEGFKNWVSSTPQSTNVDENPNQTHIDKINAKYDAELAALEGNKSTTNDEYKLDYLINKTPIKAGVEELFESNPELANSVYESLGFNKNVDLSLNLLTTTERILNGTNKKLNYSSNDIITGEETLKEIKGNFNIKRDAGSRFDLYKGDTKIANFKIVTDENDFIIDDISTVRNIRRQGVITFLIRALSRSNEMKHGKTLKIRTNILKQDGKSLLDSLEKKGIGFYTTDDLFQISPTNLFAQITPQQKQQALQLYSQYLESLNKPNTNPVLQGNQTNVEEIITQLEKDGLLEIDCKGKLKAEKGLATSFTKGSKWKVIKDLKGYPTHKEGGVDLTIGKDGVIIKNGNTQFTAKHGLVIPKN